MENLNLHKVKMYSLIIAGVALISLFLTWMKVSYIGINGLRSWGLLSLLGVGAVIAASLMGDKTKDYDVNNKKILMAGFIAIAVGALLFFLLSLKGGGSASYGGYNIGVKAGMGLWLCLLAGLAGLGLTFGLIKIPNNTNKPL